MIVSSLTSFNIFPYFKLLKTPPNQRFPNLKNPILAILSLYTNKMLLCYIDKSHILYIFEIFRRLKHNMLWSSIHHSDFPITTQSQKRHSTFIFFLTILFIRMNAAFNLTINKLKLSTIQTKFTLIIMEKIHKQDG